MRAPESLKPPGCTLFLGNLESRVTDKLLYELCCQAGPVDEVRVVAGDGGLGKRAYAFVRYKDLAGAMYGAALLRGRASLFGVPVSVNFSKDAVPPEEWSEQEQQLWVKCLSTLQTEPSSAPRRVQSRRDSLDLPPMAPRSASQQDRLQHSRSYDSGYRENGGYREDHDRYDPRGLHHSRSSPGGMQQWPSGSPAAAAAAGTYTPNSAGGDTGLGRRGGYGDYSQERHRGGDDNGYGRYQQQQEAPRGSSYEQDYRQQYSSTPGATLPGPPSTPGQVQAPSAPIAIPGLSMSVGSHQHHQQQPQHQQYSASPHWQQQQQQQQGSAGRPMSRHASSPSPATGGQYLPGIPHHFGQQQQQHQGMQLSLPTANTPLTGGSYPAPAQAHSPYVVLEHQQQPLQQQAARGYGAAAGYPPPPVQHLQPSPQQHGFQQGGYQQDAYGRYY